MTVSSHHYEKAEIGRKRRIGLRVSKRMAKRDAPRARAVEDALKSEMFVEGSYDELPRDPYW
jgi:hypothetical protein